MLILILFSCEYDSTGQAKNRFMLNVSVLPYILGFMLKPLHTVKLCPRVLWRQPCELWELNIHKIIFEIPSNQPFGQLVDSSPYRYD